MNAIYEALAGINAPVCHVPYRGQAAKYVTYQLAGQTGQFYAEGKEAETGTLCIVNVYNPTYDAAFVRAVKSALETDGWIVTVDMEEYDDRAQRSRVVLTAEREGACYG